MPVGEGILLPQSHPSLVASILAPSALSFCAPNVKPWLYDPALRHTVVGCFALGIEEKKKAEVRLTHLWVTFWHLPESLTRSTGYMFWYYLTDELYLLQRVVVLQQKVRMGTMNFTSLEALILHFSETSLPNKSTPLTKAHSYYAPR